MSARRLAADHAHVGCVAGLPQTEGTGRVFCGVG